MVVVIAGGPRDGALAGEGFTNGETVRRIKGVLLNDVIRHAFGIDRTRLRAAPTLVQSRCDNSSYTVKSAILVRIIRKQDSTKSRTG